ncbi:MAG: cytochrome-c peroxidase [Longimicrobiales bacterium]
MWLHPILLPTLTFTAVVAATIAAGRAPVAVAETTKEELGRLLFWDPVLSGHKDIACATCHHPDFAYTDGRDLPLGTGSHGLGPARASGRNNRIPVVPRNAPSLVNVAFNGLDDRRGQGQRNRRGREDFGAIAGALDEVDPARAPMFWDRRTRSLEAQALQPLGVREEMRGDAYPEDVAVDSVLARLRSIPEYVRLFQEVFGAGTSIEGPRVAEAIAAFERSLIAVNSPFDRYLAGDFNALTAQQRRGLESFQRADCDECHDGPVLSDFDLHAEGVAENRKLAQPDTGDGRFRFRTPSLRNVALTAPYMHNGTLANLEEVLRFYDRGRSENPNVVDFRGRRERGTRGPNVDRGVARLDGDFRGVSDMSEQEMQDIIAFLESLTDPDFDRTVPARVPSGLPPGGRIRSDSRADATGARRASGPPGSFAPTSS